MNPSDWYGEDEILEPDVPTLAGDEDEDGEDWDDDDDWDEDDEDEADDEEDDDLW